MLILIEKILKSFNYLFKIGKQKPTYERMVNYKKIQIMAI